MGRKRKSYSGEIKARVALEAIKGQRTINEIASEYGLHPNQIMQWKKQVTEELPLLFSDKRKKKEETDEQLQAQLYQQIGQLKVELDWLKKKLDISIKEKRSLVEVESEILTISQQCELLSLARSSFYYEAAMESEENLALMRMIDELYTRLPFYGRPRLTEQLKKLGYEVNHKRVGRLMRKMGIEAIYPKPKLSLANSGHKIYPYLLRGVEIRRNNQVWSTDITYIRLKQGFIYLVAILDWYSRYVLAWEISNTMDVSFCLAALERALNKAQPEIFNSDQGSQFTSKEFTARLEVADIRISMDGRGRVFDNIFIERFWRSLKYEAVYLHDYENVSIAIAGLARYFQFYNNERLHQSLDYKTPAQVYFELAV